jgi:chromosome segregation ATPase
VTADVEKAEARVGAINETFCDPTYFEKTPQKEVRKLETEQKDLKEKIDALMGEWESIEKELEQISG